MQHEPDPAAPEPAKPDVQQAEIGSGTPPSRIPEAQPDVDVQPDQQPVRDTPDVRGPGSASP
ncbi:hypothetical protein [Paraburkholderia sp.]|jgi:hypothetical protein|uniref:hypothetical protein n=1 Tax=Paraburkholderia sp. TaxID=1926495 RepID=UPI002F3F8EC5